MRFCRSPPCGLQHAAAFGRDAGDVAVGRHPRDRRQQHATTASRGQHQREPEARLSRGKLEFRRHDAGNAVRLTVEGDERSDRRRGAVEVLLPRRVAQHNLPHVTIAGGEGVANQGRRAEDVEQIRCRRQPGQANRAAGRGQRPGRVVIERDRREARRGAGPLERRRCREGVERHLLPARRARLDPKAHDPIGVRIRQWPQQHRLNDGEDRGWGAESQRQRGDRRQRKGPPAGQQPHGVRGVAGTLEEHPHHGVDDDVSIRQLSRIISSLRSYRSRRRAEGVSDRRSAVKSARRPCRAGDLGGNQSFNHLITPR